MHGAPALEVGLRPLPIALNSVRNVGLKVKSFVWMTSTEHRSLADDFAVIC